MEFSVARGDIASQFADALVNAAGTSLRMGSGVAGALRRAGGSKLDEAARERGPVYDVVRDAVDASTETGDATDATDAHGAAFDREEG